ncbi:MAG: hypothetical protein Q9220_001121 [cf. Caloplaca sp. 1 TL-2023]
MTTTSTSSASSSQLESNPQLSALRMAPKMESSSSTEASHGSPATEGRDTTSTVIVHPLSWRLFDIKLMITRIVLLSQVGFFLRKSFFLDTSIDDSHSGGIQEWMTVSVAFMAGAALYYLLVYFVVPFMFWLAEVDETEEDEEWEQVEKVEDLDSGHKDAKKEKAATETHITGYDGYPSTEWKYRGGYFRLERAG